MMTGKYAEQKAATKAVKIMSFPGDIRRIDV
jgi:hypothetical protein